MRKISLFILMAALAALFAACGAPADNKPANTNTNANTAKAVAAAPTADALLDMEKKAQDAYIKGDGAYFEGMLADKAVMGMGKALMGKAAIVAMIRTAKCEGVVVKLSEGQLSKINDDTFAFTYKNESTGKCSEGDGKMTEMKPMRASTVWVRSGEKWLAAWHGENPIMGAPAADTKDEVKKEEPKKEVKAAVEPKKDEKAAAETKKDEKAAEPKKDEKSPEPAKLTPSANTDALVKIHAGGWEAFRNRDAKAFDSIIASTFANVGPDGSYVGSKADVIKKWTETMKCEGITKTSFTEGFAVAISPTVEMLIGKGNADGKCDGRPNGDIWQTAAYVKEGDAWKLAFMFESMGM